MNRIPLIDPTLADGKSKPVFDSIQSKFGGVPNVFRIFGNSPAALKSYVEQNAALAGGILTPQLREQLAIMVSEINGCGYCLSAHVVFGGKVGLDREQMESARHARADDDRTNAALEFAHSVIRERGNVSPKELDAVRGAGFGNAEILEIVCQVALTTLTNYVNNLAETIIDFPVVTPGEFLEASAASA
ncbi:MAG: carboxymuconolactone decarboxylase family protein [Chthoniobacteraceae bacterium]